MPAVMAIDYIPRFVTEAQLVNLINLWWLARGVTKTRHERFVKAAEWFHQENPGVSTTAAYKDLVNSVTEY